MRVTVCVTRLRLWARPYEPGADWQRAGDLASGRFGFGVQRPDVSLGTLIADGTGAALTYPWMFCFSAGLLVVLVLAVNLIGDGLRDAIDPTSATPIGSDEASTPIGPEP